MTTENAKKAPETTEETELQLNNVRFIYFGRDKGSSSHNGVTCVGYHLTENTHDAVNTITMGFSFCSPLDSFSRKKARMAILGRLNSDRHAQLVVSNKVVPTYENVTNVIKDFINASLPDADFSDVKAVAIANNFESASFPSIGGVSLPWWFKGV